MKRITLDEVLNTQLSAPLTFIVAVGLITTLPFWIAVGCLWLVKEILRAIILFIVGKWGC